MAKRLTEAQIEHYSREGYVSPVEALSPGEAERAFHAAAAERFKAANTEQTRRYAEGGTP